MQNKSALEQKPNYINEEMVVKNKQCQKPDHWIIATDAQAHAVSVVSLYTHIALISTHRAHCAHLSVVDIFLRVRLHAYIDTLSRKPPIGCHKPECHNMIHISFMIISNKR